MRYPNPASFPLSLSSPCRKREKVLKNSHAFADRTGSVEQPATQENDLSPLLIIILLFVIVRPPLGTTCIPSGCRPVGNGSSKYYSKIF